MIAKEKSMSHDVKTQKAESLFLFSFEIARFRFLPSFLFLFSLFGSFFSPLFPFFFFLIVVLFLKEVYAGEEAFVLAVLSPAFFFLYINRGRAR
jgi:hypothetical protein